MSESGWSVTRLKYIAEANARVLPENTDPEFEFTYIDIGSVTQGKVTIPDVRVAFRDAPSRARRVASPADTVVSTVRTYLRAVAPVPRFIDPLIFSTGFAVLHPNNKVVPRFLSWYLQSDDFVARVEASSVGVSYPAITADALMALSLALPPTADQRAIADYLDRETAQIDTLIAKQEQLIARLGERRNELVAQCVVPSSAVSPSAQESWLNDTPPPGWIKGPLKHFGMVTLGKMLQTTPTTGGELRPYLRAANVQPDGKLALDDVRKMWFGQDELRELDLKAGDVVVVEGGMGGYGRAAHLSNDLPGMGFQNSINRIRPYPGNDGRFLAHFLLMAREKGFITAYCNVVSMPHLTAEKLRSFPIFIPPQDEQRRIADHLDEQTAKIDTLIEKAERFIELARERRAALITAAVTGQLDVSAA